MWTISGLDRDDKGSRQEAGDGIWLCPADVLREMLGKRRDGAGMALGCGGAVLSITRGMGRAFFSTCYALSSPCCT